MVEAVSKDNNLEKAKQKINEEFLIFVQTVLLKAYMSKEQDSVNSDKRETVIYQL